MQILIIDDSRQLAQAYLDILSSIGFQCQVAYTAKDAFAHLASNTPDMILLDLRLGHEIGGEDILHQIRANPRLDRTRVIIITAYPEVAKMVTELADLTLIKPVDVDQLVALTGRIGSYEVAPKTFHFRDPVTQLFNQDFFHIQMEQAFARSQRRQDFTFAVILIEVQVQNMEEEEIPPDLWAALARQVARRLRRQMRMTDTVARFSAWQFAILAEELKNRGDHQVIVTRVNQALSAPYPVEQELYHLSTCFGFTEHKPEFKQPEDMLATARRMLHKSL